MSITSALRAGVMSVLTPLLEKNVTKTFALDVPVVFSMSRIIVLAFATGMLRQLWRIGVAGWPESTLAISIVLALPILGAMERANPDQLLRVTRSLIDRFGIGDTGHSERSEESAPGSSATEPSKYDDHRDDG